MDGVAHTSLPGEGGVAIPLYLVRVEWLHPSNCFGWSGYTPLPVLDGVAHASLPGVDGVASPLYLVKVEWLHLSTWPSEGLLALFPCCGELEPTPLPPPRGLPPTSAPSVPQNGLVQKVFIYIRTAARSVGYQIPTACVS